jgi:transcriptional regulator with XRE-family HTH domain
MTKHLDPNRRFYLRERRLAAGLTQQDLAEAIGTTKGVVSQLETGFARYNEDWVTKAAAALGIEPAELLLPPESPAPKSSYDLLLSEVLTAWPHISDRDRHTLASLAKSLSQKT